MKPLSIIKLVVKNLRARKGRTILTILGITIGVAGVIIIMSLGGGAQSLILGQVTKLGSNLLYIIPGRVADNGAPIPGLVITSLVENDAQALRNKGRLPYVSAVAASVSGTANITWNNKTVDTTFSAIDEDYTRVVDFTMQSGQFFSAAEEDGGANVVVLGSEISDELFKDSGTNPIGQVIKIKSVTQNDAGGVPLRVIGVIASRGSSFFQNQDRLVFLPLTIGQNQILGINHLNSIQIKVSDSAYVDDTIATIKTVLKQQHHILDEADVDFEIRNQAEAVKILSTITDALSLFLVAMAGISLVVGGIGILNIMVATVGERTREIGLRKAVGATKKAIRNQFLLEAVLLTSLGGFIGIIIGVLVSYIIALVMQKLDYDWAFIISVGSILLSVGVSVLTGIVFGLFPAIKAAKLDPIDALRYE
ncbi:MAG: ABC transporter permease [Candidatus Falkowbacteria bacterium]|nr:MAG: ABC transporter permease [Candidatus Falkowbacteria bacterium]